MKINDLINFIGMMAIQIRLCQDDTSTDQICYIPLSSFRQIEITYYNIILQSKLLQVFLEKFMQLKKGKITFLLCLNVLFCLTVFAADIDELKVKRKDVFEFTEKPKITRDGDIVTITFTSKDYCDVSVAIEDGNGKIIRHLVSGVLGDNAPEQFQKSSLSQKLIWDGKDDQGKLTDNKDDLTVRVSLGVKPIFEKNLYWSPYKRISQAAPIIAACEEGVLVYEAYGVDSVKLYDHDGVYLRTVYPFPSTKIEGIKSLDWKDFPQGMRLPWKQSVYQQTFLTSGENCSIYDQGGRQGRGATGMAALGKRVVLGYMKLNRFNTDGSCENLTGGKTASFLPGPNKSVIDIGPTSMAISPDNKWVYLAGYSYRYARNFDTHNGVQKIALDGSEDATLFVGTLGSKDTRALGEGTEPSQFQNATSVDCDAQGRVYVGDYMNNRIQVFSPDAKFLKEIKTNKPAVVRVNRKTGEIHVFSWAMPSHLLLRANPRISFQSEYARFGSFDNPKELARMPLPIPQFTGQYGTYIGLPHPLFYWAEIDFFGKEPTIWFGRDCRNDIEMGIHPGNGGQTTSWEESGIKLLREKDGKLEVFRDFGKETAKEVVRAKPPTNLVQHIYVNPVDGKLYLAEADSAPTTKASMQWLEIDPESAKIKKIDLPFNPIDAAFDLNGLVYIRNTDWVVRYELNTWKEIPFDYGEESNAVGRDGGIGGRSTPVVSGIRMPSKSPVCYHQGGINISPKGYIIASCAYRFEGISGPGGTGENIQFDRKVMAAQGKEYEPPMFPGRASNSTTPSIHVWDKHGKILYEDAVPGVGQVDGVGMDINDGIYFLHTKNRVLDGKPYFNHMLGTMMKVKPGKSKFLSTSGAPVPLPVGEYPKTPTELFGMYVKNAEWFYPGVGFSGFSASQAGGGCACWFPRFALDLYGRSICPEPQQFAVSLIDPAGNLILRIGKYGNVDNAGPNSLIPMGGDEVSLFHPLYVGTHTDRRIYISDAGNGRLISVKLGYYAEEKVALKNVSNKSK